MGMNENSSAYPCPKQSDISFESLKTRKFGEYKRDPENMVYCYWVTANEKVSARPAPAVIDAKYTYQGSHMLVRANWPNGVTKVVPLACVVDLPSYATWEYQSLDIEAYKRALQSCGLYGLMFCEAMISESGRLREQVTNELLCFL